MRHKLRKWITGILCATMIASAFPVYASETYESDVPEVIEQEVVEENADTYEISSAPETNEIDDSDVITDAENAVGSGSLILRDSETYDSISEFELYTEEYKWIDVLIDDNYASSSYYSCVSSDENIVKISDYSSYGFKAVGVSAGSASITITTSEGAECTLNVTVKDTEITFAKQYGSTLTSLTLGTNYNSTKDVVVYRNDAYMSTDDCTCTSSDESVVKVQANNDDSWTVKGVSAGTATITASNQSGESGTLIVTVLNSGEDGYLYQDAQGNILEYQIYNNEIIITGYTKAKGSITIPSQIGGLNVTEIEGNAFSGCTSITKLTVSNGIKNIGYASFASCTGLLSVELPDSVENIGSWAFSGCSGLKSFRIPPKVTMIEDYTFNSCKLSSVTIPSGVTYIGYDAFSWCALASVILPASLEEIEYGAFSGNPLKTIKIPAKVKILDEYSLGSIETLESIEVDADNEYFSSKNGVLFNKDQTEILRYPVARSNLYYEIPAGVTEINSYAFDGANNLMSVTIPESVTYIGSNAFHSSSLNYLYLLSNTAPVATADAITKYYYYDDHNIIIAVPKGATGYDEAPWTNFTVKKEGTVRPASATFNATEFTVPSWTNEPYKKVTVSPSGAVCKEVFYKIGDKEVYSFSSGTFSTGDPGTYTLTAITKDGHATAKVKLVVKNNSKYFSDMWDYKHPYYKAIYWAAEHGITNGYSDGTFGVNRNCTRGESVMFLWKMMGKPAVKEVAQSPFQDVPKTHSFYKAVLWAQQNGITKGYTSGPKKGKFGVNDPCTRGQIMCFIWRAKGMPAPKAVSGSPFRDVPTTHAYYKAILWGSQNGVTKGYTSGPNAGKFGINDNCTRGQIVKFLYNIR